MPSPSTPPRTETPPRARRQHLAIATTAGLAALLVLTSCADPTSSAAPAGTDTATHQGSEKTADLSPTRERPKATRSEEAAALVPASVRADGKLTVATSAFAAPLSVYATDNKTPVGSDPDIASALADTLGLELELVPVSWEDWPLGVSSGKYEAVISNVTVTEQRKKTFDMASYREDKLGFYVKSDSTIGELTEAADVAGLRIVVGSGTNQEKVLLEWDKQNRKAGLEPIQFQYYDNDSASSLALQSGRADATFGPNATGAYRAAQDGKSRLAGLVPGGWPETAHISVTAKKGTGLGKAAQVGLEHLIQTGVYTRILRDWGLTDEAITASELNPEGLQD